jgi:hypothetical protein
MYVALLYYHHLFIARLLVGIFQLAVAYDATSCVDAGDLIHPLDFGHVTNHDSIFACVCVSRRRRRNNDNSNRIHKKCEYSSLQRRRKRTRRTSTNRSRRRRFGSPGVDLGEIPAGQVLVGIVLVGNVLAGKISDIGGHGGGGARGE